MNVQTCSEAEWGAFIETSPHASVFVTPWFIEAVGSPPEFWVVKEGEAIVAGVPILLDGGQPIAGLPPFSMYVGPLLSGAVAAEPPHRRLPIVLRALDALLAALTGRYDALTFSMHYHWDDLRAFSWFNYHEPQAGRFALTTFYTGVLPLADVNWQGSIRKSRRQDADKARKAGLVCELSEDIDLLSRLYLATFERQGIAVDAATMTTLGSIARAAIRTGNGFLNVCRDRDGQALSAILIVHDRRSAYYLVGANDPAGRPFGAGTFLLVDSIRHSRDRSLSAFDFVGINSPRRGDFKTSFNASPHLYIDATWRRPAKPVI